VATQTFGATTGAQRAIYLRAIAAEVRVDQP
jgi:hypothetical protein